jgi:hypothetical protein
MRKKFSHSDRRTTMNRTRLKAPNSGNRSRLYLAIHLASDLCGSTAKGYATCQEARNALKFKRCTLATVRWLDNWDIPRAIGYWKHEPYIRGKILHDLVTGDLACGGYEGSRHVGKMEDNTTHKQT